MVFFPYSSVSINFGEEYVKCMYVQCTSMMERVQQLDLIEGEELLLGSLIAIPCSHKIRRLILHYKGACIHVFQVVVQILF